MKKIVKLTRHPNRGVCLNIPLFLIGLCLSFTSGGEIEAAPLTGPAGSSRAEVAPMLKHIKTGIEEYDNRLKSGEIEFSVTLLEKHRPTGYDNFLSALLVGGWKYLTARKNAEATYEVAGYWEITYRFQGDTHFFDVKADTKRHISGGSVWTKTEAGGYSTEIYHQPHHQYLVQNKKVFIRDGDVWKPFEKKTRVGGRGYFDERYSPLWWRLPPSSNYRFPPRGDGFQLRNTFEQLIYPYKTLVIKKLQTEGNLSYHLRVSDPETRPETRYGDTTLTRDIYLDPQKGFHATRLVATQKSAGFAPYEGSWWPLRRGGKELSVSVSRNIKTYQLSECEPGLWFPEVVTEEEVYNGDYMFELYPDTPVSEYPEVVSSFLDDPDLPEWFAPIESYKRVMKVHRAVFNIPVSIPDVGP